MMSKRYFIIVASIAMFCVFFVGNLNGQSPYMKNKMDKEVAREIKRANSQLRKFPKDFLKSRGLYPIDSCHIVFCPNLYLDNQEIGRYDTINRKNIDQLYMQYRWQYEMDIPFRFKTVYVERTFPGFKRFPSGEYYVINKNRRYRLAPHTIGGTLFSHKTKFELYPISRDNSLFIDIALSKKFKYVFNIARLGKDEIFCMNEDSIIAYNADLNRYLTLDEFNQIQCERKKTSQEEMRKTDERIELKNQKRRELVLQLRKNQLSALNFTAQNSFIENQLDDEVTKKIKKYKLQLRKAPKDTLGSLGLLPEDSCHYFCIPLLTTTEIETNTDTISSEIIQSLEPLYYWSGIRFPFSRRGISYKTELKGELIVLNNRNELITIIQDGKSLKTSRIKSYPISFSKKVNLIKFLLNNELSKKFEHLFRIDFMGPEYIFCKNGDSIQVYSSELDMLLTIEEFNCLQREYQRQINEIRQRKERSE